MKRAEIIAFLKDQFLGDLEAKLDESLQSSSDEQLSALYKALVAEDPVAREAAQQMITEQSSAAAPKIDMSKLNQPKKIDMSKLKKPRAEDDGEQVW